MADYLVQSSRQKHMCDDFQLKRLGFYLSLLQLLRQLNGHIEQSAADVEHLRGSIMRLLSKIQDENQLPRTLFFKSREDHHGAYRCNFTQKFFSLAPILFNAQSVREAVKGTQINQFLLVFIVVTILCLPPTFVATFYGMDLFINEESLLASQTQFWIIPAAVTGATYVLAVVLVLSSAEQVKTVLKSPAKMKNWLSRSGLSSKKKRSKKRGGLQKTFGLKKEAKPEQQQV
ncbi:hypothetical protein QBC44DRAFT_371091 [Cladorrhinum sp. PSN332]|nr:hypothetical protein QBC44DRAFT_371091 [Cladorrhinum sp. PSN332]